MQKKEHEDTIHALLNLHFEKQEEVNRNSKRDYVDLLTNISLKTILTEKR